MLTNLELYGTEDVPAVPKATANARIALLRQNLKRNRKNYTEVKIIEAIRFWQKLSHQEDTGV